VKDTDLSPAGIEITDACTNAGLPIRPTTLPLQPIHSESSETFASQGESPPRSASAELVVALGGQPRTEPLDMEEIEPTEARAPRRAVSPEDPTDAEVEAHKLSGHACFRSWCRHCVRGRGTEAPHSRVKPPESAVPVISWDYCYLSSSKDNPDPASGSESPVLVMWDSRSKGLFAHLVPSKGTDYEELDAVLKMFAADLDRLGYKRVAFRSDNESAIVAFLKELKRYWPREVIPEAPEIPRATEQPNAAFA